MASKQPVKDDRANKDGKSIKKGGKGGKSLADGTDHRRMGGLDINDGPAYLDSGDPNYVPEEHNPGAGRGSPRKSMDPNVDAANREAVSYAPRSGKPDTHSAFNEKNFFAVPTPVLTEEDLAKDA